VNGLFHGIELKGSCRKGDTSATFTFKSIRLQDTNWKHLLLVGRVRDPTSWLSIEDVESHVWLGYCLLFCMHATPVSACHTRRLCVPHPPLRATTVDSDGHGVMAIHRAQTREARGLHQSPHDQRPVAPRAARRHRNAPLQARMAELGRVLDPARAPHAGVVGAARAQGGGAGVGVGTACCMMLCVTAGVDLCYDCAGGLMPGGCD